MSEQKRVDDRFDEGIRIRREVMGDDFVAAALSRNAGTDGEDLQRHITETVWGSVWNRPGLGRRDRSLMNIGMLIALRAPAALSAMKVVQEVLEKELGPLPEDSGK